MKRGKKMILLLGAWALLMIGYVCIGRMNETAVVSETEGSFSLWPEEKTVSSLTWTKDGEEYAFSLGESVWTKDGDASFPVNQSALQNLAKKIAGLTADRELTDVTRPEDYGLAAPAFSVTVRDEDGSETVYAMGDQTPFEDGYYLSVSGSGSVYVIASSLATAFDKTLTQLASMESMPEVTDVTRMTVGDTLDICQSDGVWVDTATGEMLDQSAAQALVSEAKGLTWSELIATDATDEQLAQWALDDAQAVAVTLFNGETAERTLLLGGKDDETDRYARLPDSRMVYTFYSDDADDLLEAGIDTLWQRKPVSVTVDELSEAAFAWDGGEAVLTAQDGESTAMQSVIELLNSLEGTERVTLGEPGEEVLRVTLTDDGGETQAFVFRAYNVDSYLLEITDMHGMLVPAQDVDRLIRMLKQKG
ncbi:MAG: DUF4340 domain-containing protein [Candidatus Ventricola sp.]